MRKNILKRYLRFLFPYLLCAFLPLLFVLAVRLYSVQSIKQGILDTAEKEFSYCSEKLETQIRSINDTIFNLSNLALNSPLCEAQTPYRNTSTTMRALEFQAKMEERLNVSNDAYRYFCYFDSPEVVVGSKMTFLSAEKFYGDYLTYGNLSLKDWDTQIMQGKQSFYPAEAITEFGVVSGRYIIYVQKFSQISQSKGNVVALISPNIITPFVETLSRLGGGIEIRDIDNQLLFSYPSQHPDTWENTETAHLFQSSVLGWKLTGVLPQSYIDDAMKESNFYLWSLLLSCIMISVVVSLAFGYRALQTLNIINQAVSESFGVDYYGGVSDARRIAQSIDSIANENANLSLQYQQQKDIVENSQILSILRGAQLLYPENKETPLSNFTQSARKLVLWVRICSVEGISDGEGVHHVIDFKHDLRMLLTRLYDQMFLCDVSMHEVVILVAKECGPGILTEELQALFLELSGRTQDMPGIALQVGFSDEFLTIFNVSQYYGQASEVMEYHNDSKETCILTYRMERGTGSTDHIIRPVKEYVQAHFCDSTLSIVQAAEMMQLSVPYLSKVFKDSVGDTFSSYVEQMRISKACELLNGGESVENTAAKVGYNSTNTFRNSFKRRLGVLPNEYRHGGGGESK